MSEHTDPQPPAAPPPGWTPPPLSGADRPSLAGVQHPSRFEAPAPSDPSTTIGQFAAPRTIWPVVVGVVAVLAAVLIWTSTTLRPVTPSASKPSPTPSVAATSDPGLPFVSPDERYSGHWEVLRHEWTDSGVELQIRISVERGPLHYSFLAFENNGVTATDPQPSTHLPRMSGFAVETGQTETGWIFMPLIRGQATLILADAGGQQMSALPIPG